MGKIYCILLILLGAVTVSCSKESVPDNGKPAILKLETSIVGAQENVRAAVNGTNFAAQNGVYTLGVCIFNSGSTDPVNEAVRGYHNLETEINVTAGTNQDEFNQVWKYYFDEGGDKSDKSGNKFHYASDYLTIPIKTTVDVYAYYPWSPDVSDPEVIKFESGDDDWMWAEPVKNIEISDVRELKVPLKFRHAMTCIEVNIRLKYEGSVEVTKITLRDSKGRIYSKGFMNSTNGVLDLSDDDKVNEISVKPNIRLKTGFNTACYLIFPEIENLELANATHEGDLELVFEFNGVKGKDIYRLPATMKDANGNQIEVTAMETGKKYKYVLILDNITTFAPVEIEDNIWKPEKIDIII